MTTPTIEPVTQLPALARRRADSHKGDFGRVLVVAGSRGMSGAAVLCASAALRGGAGLVRVALPGDILPIVAAANPCYMTAPLPHDEYGRFAELALTELLALVDANNVLAVGPGLGQSPALSKIVSTLLTQAPLPIVLDADGLNALAENLAPLKARTGSTILTPHPGEFGRLAKVDTARVQAERSELAVAFAAEHSVVLVLKGHRTLVTDGKRLYENTTGNPGMATGGSGDVLTGLIAALVGQGLDAFGAAQLGVHVHGLAGDLARDDIGAVGLTASDLVRHIPKALTIFQG
jgi:NAD(P)H-hydrate epimerase